MLNRFTKYWYGEEEETEEDTQQRNEEMRRRRLQQFQGTGDATPTTSSDIQITQSISEETSEPLTAEFSTASENEPPAAQPSVTGSAIVKTITKSDNYGPDNPWSEWEDRSPSPEHSLDSQISLLISRIYLVTVSTEPQHHTQPQYQTMLLDTAATVEMLSGDDIEQVLQERISMTSEELRDCTVECGGAKSETFQPLTIVYLLSCAKRCSEEQGRCSGRGRGVALSETIAQCREATLHMIRSLLLDDSTLFTQLINCLMPAASSSTYTEIDKDIAIKLYLELLALSDDNVTRLSRPLLDFIIFKSMLCTLNDATVTLELLDTLNTLVSNKAVAKIVPTLAGWLPNNPDSGVAYHDTLLGHFLGCSTIRKPHEISPLTKYISPYFYEYSMFNQSITEHSQGQYQTLIDSIQTRISKLLYHLIKSDAKRATLDWIALCLEANGNRAKLVSSFISMGSVSDGFMLNMSSVLLKLCSPFLGPLNPKLAMIDARFCGPGSNSGLSQEGADRILKGDATALAALGTPQDFNFITFCFYATHRALQLAYTAPFDKYRRLMKTLMETQHLLEATRGSSLAQEVRERFEEQFIEQLEVKTHMLHPDIITRVLLFYSSSSNWMCHVSLSRDITISPHLNLTEDPTITLAMIPSYFISAACQFLINIRYFAEVNLENFVSDNLNYIVTFLVLFCDKKWVPNPHTRAELVEALTVFIPNERAKSSVPTHNRQAALCCNVLAKARLGSVLISLFVDIEHTAQFEHKFQYRYHIFEILEFAWPRGFNVHVLSETVKGAEEDTTVLFTKFIKLLLNDANFLLDEALRGLEEIKKLQMLHDDTAEWEQLDEPTRQGKLRTLAELKRMCTSHNILSYETIKCICYMTQRCDSVTEAQRQCVTYAFVTPLLVDTLVTMLNYYLKELVGDNQTKYKVKKFEEVKFYPAKLLQTIVLIYINLSTEDAFISAIPRDRRSYHAGLFTETATKLRKLLVEEEILEQLLLVSEMASKQVESQEDEELLSDRAPSHYLDPILGTLMKEPVMLPKSKVIVDRAVIGKHLLSDPIDPFNRQPLAMADVVPQVELRNEILAWKTEQMAEIKSQGSSKS